jgi:glutamate synthase domain-containing protein 3
LTFTIDCRGKTTRQINRELRQAIAAGERDLRVLKPDARHNLGVALLQPVRVVFEGSVGYYCAGMMDGTVVIDGNAGSGVAASIRGGTVAVRGDAAARAGVSMKGGTLLIGGGCGYMAGFMMQKGTIIICGDAGEALADSMYEGTVFVGGTVASLGNDAVIQAPNAEECEELGRLLATYGIERRPAFKKVVSGRKLWNFDKKDLDVWKAAL